MVRALKSGLTSLGSSPDYAGALRCVLGQDTLLFQSSLLYKRV